ncbi:MAG: hypothetical protein WBF04_24165 [Candidatus Sulfotelmatobacter sp.]
MPFLDTMKTLLNLAPPRPKMGIISINSFSPEDLPKGFFRVRTVSGKETLGYSGGFVTYDCGATVVDGAKRLTLDKPLADLPLVELNYRNPNSNVINGTAVIETDSMESDGEVSWSGAPPSPGVTWR